MEAAIPYNSFLRDLTGFFGFAIIPPKYAENGYLDEIESELAKFVKLKKKKVGLALNSKTSINSIKFFIPKFDLILLMTGCPGKDGTRFLHSSYKKIKRLRKISPEIIIEVDGGVNDKNIKKLKNSGANHFVIGSYFQECKNVSLNLKRLKKLVN